MDSRTVKSQYLTTVNDQLEVMEYESGFLVWVPLRHSDDDAVALTIRPDSSGWIVTDEGSTMTRLRNLGANLDSDRFRASWRELARPGTGFVPNKGHDEEIISWGGVEELGEMLARVAEAAIRAEGLAHMADGRRSGPSFSDRVAQVVKMGVGKSHSGGVVKPRGRMALRTGGERQVTATVEYESKVLLAVQALGGRDKDGRLRSHDVAYATFGPSALPQDQRLAVAIGSEKMWDRYLIKDIEDVARVRFFDHPGQVESELSSMMSGITSNN